MNWRSEQSGAVGIPPSSSRPRWQLKPLAPPRPLARLARGQVPAVVLRGSKESYMAEVSVCYLLHFDRITTAGGAFQ